MCSFYWKGKLLKISKQKLSDTECKVLLEEMGCSNDPEHVNTMASLFRKKGSIYSELNRWFQPLQQIIVLKIWNFHYMVKVS